MPWRAWKACSQRSPRRHELSVNVTRSASATSRPQALPYVVYVSAAYRPDIISELCQFFTDHHLELEA